jgi:hypothetical protein
MTPKAIEIFQEAADICGNPTGAAKFLAEKCAALFIELERCKLQYDDLDNAMSNRIAELGERVAKLEGDLNRIENHK